MLDIQNILNFTHDELAEYTGIPRGTMGITMMEHLQNIYKCQGRLRTDNGCEKCFNKNKGCFLVQNQSMTMAILIELAEYMRKEKLTK